MKYAEVAVNSPIARQRSFCYSVPEEIAVSIGCAVWVPFGSKIVQGIVVGISDIPSYRDIKDITSLIYTEPLISRANVSLASWLSQYYVAPLFDCIALMLPPGFQKNRVTYFKLSPISTSVAQINPDQLQVIKLFQGKEKIKLIELQQIFGKKKANKLVHQMIREKYLVKVEQIAEIKIKPQVTIYYELQISGDLLHRVIEQLQIKRATAQIDAINLLLQHKGYMSSLDFKKSFAKSMSVIQILEKKGFICKREIRTKYNCLPIAQPVISLPLILTEDQETAWQAIHPALVGADNANSQAVFLLAGVTGSGKTEIYLKALAEIIAMGKKGIYLVPEIALVAQAVERLENRFPGRVAILHSELTISEQFDQWHKIQGGECDIVIGPRSALFAPQLNLGLIIIDEEHEWAYKQIDKSPHYHARTTAIKLAELVGANVILGSATPDLETFYQAQRKNYKFVELKHRITSRGYASLPEVEVIDIKDELKSGNRGIFSNTLSRSISEVLQRQEQAILFLNRRGTANFLRCQSCGHVFNCSRCSVALTHHSVTGKLICHHCNYSIAIPHQCPNCRGSQLKYYGIGTQKVEEEVLHLFPKARTIRWDRDTTRKRGSHDLLLTKFRSHGADILIGTQMVAKGLDLPDVTLVGVINADTGLNLPDFRASERTFQLICQVAGRAGRGSTAGRVIVQTYCPKNYAIRAGAHHDYIYFYQKEIEYRRSFHYPPFSQMALLTFSHTNSLICRREAETLAGVITDKIRKMKMVQLRLIGPMPSFLSRRKGHYQWQLILIGIQLSEFINNNVILRQGWIVDIDPVSMI